MRSFVPLLMASRASQLSIPSTDRGSIAINCPLCGIFLVIMSDQLAISLGDLFMGAFFPGLILGALDIVFIVVYGLVSPSSMPAPENREDISWQAVKEVLIAVLPPLFLILLVLGSIFAGFATPTEASGLGALGATILALANGKLNFKVMREVSYSTVNITGYIIGIFLAANFFAFVLRRYGGDEIIEGLVLSAFDDPYLTVLFILSIIFLLGFLLDWIEITIIVMPLMLPVILGLDLDIPGFDQVRDPSIVWFAILAPHVADIVSDPASWLRSVLFEGRVSAGCDTWTYLSGHHPLCSVATRRVDDRVPVPGTDDVAPIGRVWGLGLRFHRD